MAAQARTKEEVIARLNALQPGNGAGVEEAHHLEADQLLTDALLLAGMGDVVSAYLEAKSRVGFWYS